MNFNDVKNNIVNKINILSYIFLVKVNFVFYSNNIGFYFQVN